MRGLGLLRITAITVGYAVASVNCAEAGDAVRGEHAYIKCMACHAKGMTNGIGPACLESSGDTPDRYRASAIAKP